MKLTRLRSQIALIAGSSAIGQLIIIVSAPIVSRLFTPDHFGVTAGYSFLLTVLLTMNSLRYEFAIPLPKRDEEASNLTALTLSLVILLSLIFTAVVWAFADEIAVLFNEPRILTLLPLLPFGLIMGGIMTALNYWLTRRKDFATLGVAQISSSISQVSSQIIAGLSHMGVLGLAISFLIGQAVTCLIYARRALPLQQVKPRTWLPLAREYKDFPLFTTAASLVDVAGTYLPSVFFLATFSASEAGYFSLTLRLMSLPSALVANAVAQVFYPRLSEVRDDQQALRALFEKVAVALLIISFTGFGFVLVAGRQLFAIVLGEAWLTAGIYAQMLAPFFLIAFVLSPLTSLILVYDRQRAGLVFSIAVTSLRVVALIAGSLIESALVSVALFMLASFVPYLIYLVWLLHLAGLRLDRWLWSLRGFLTLNLMLILLGFAFSQLPALLLVGIGFALVALFYLRRLNLS